jgi:putative transposase
MARPLRINYPGAFYHVTSRGNEQKDVFKSERDREKFLEYLESATRRYDAVIHVYCLMDNHYHLLLETPSGNLPQIMRHINGAYTTYFNVKRGRSGHLFQGRYKAILVDIDEYAKELSRYIHLNPVRAKMVKTPEEYKWSSYPFYIGKKKSPQWLHSDFILQYFGNKASIAQKRYRNFATAMLNKKYDNPLDEVVGSTLLGSPDFIAFIKDKFISNKKPDKDLPVLKELTDKASMKDIFDAVESVFGNQEGLDRNIKMFLCQRYTGEKLKDIGTYFRIGESGVSQACRRIKYKIRNDKKLEGKIAKIERKLSGSRKKTSQPDYKEKDVMIMRAEQLLKEKRHDVIALAAKHGAKNLRIFGSVARGESHTESDIDLLVKMEDDRSLLDLSALRLDLRDLLGIEVDVVSEDGLYWLLRRRILKEARPL